MIRVFLALLLPSLALAQTPSGWPLHGYDLAGTRFSPLTQIDTATVARLEPRWTWHSGVTATFQATPIVLDTVMYVSLPFSGVAALDARDGRELWRYRHEPRTDEALLRTGKPRGRGRRGTRSTSGRPTGGWSRSTAAPARSGGT